MIGLLEIEIVNILGVRNLGSESKGD
jgi:hypothetical protein